MEPHLKILHTVSEAVSRTLDVEAILKTALEALTHVTGHEIASLHLVATDGVTLELRADRGLSGQMREVNRVLTVGEGIIGRVAASGTTAVMRDVMGSPDLLPSAHEAVRRDRIRGFVCVPIHARGRMLGTLSLGRQTDDPFDEGEVTLLEATAQQIAIALDNARLSSELVHAEKLSAVGELASGVAHEINNPLTTILGLAQLLLSRSDVTPGIRERIALMADEAARAAAIVQNLLMFSRHYPPERRPCSLADAVQRVIALKGYQLEHDKVRVTTELDHCPTVWADENQVQQVLLNLVQNAHQAMARQASERVLTVRLRPRDRHVAIEVLDNGPGIPPHLLSRIFDPFFTTKPPGEGSGLGLPRPAPVGDAGRHQADPRVPARGQRRPRPARQPRGVDAHLDRPRDPPDPARWRQHPHRSALLGAREPRRLRRPAPAQPARPRLRGPAADRRRGDLARPLRPPRPPQRRAAGGRRLSSGGDTGYSGGFREVGARLGPFDLALVSIAAYEPPAIMRFTHTTPEEALHVFTDLGARTFVAMHWGTFDLSDEPLDEPPRRLRAAARAMRLPDERVWVLAHGETRRF